MDFHVTEYFTHAKSPDRFKRIYLLLAFSCLVAILAVSIVVITRNTRNSLLEDAEIDSEKTAAVLLFMERTTIKIKSANDNRTLDIDTAAIPGLDQRIRGFLNPLEIVKIKVYDRAKRIIYSTDPSLIGKLDSENKRLKAALAGVRQSVMKESQSITDLVDEKRFDADVAEVYVPVRDKDGFVAGVFELYTDVSRLKASLRSQLTASIVFLVSAILLMSLISYAVIVRESNELRKAYLLLETLATSDSLTGIFNRRYLLERAGDLFTMMQRSREKLEDVVGIGFVMIDVDHFKLVNDNFGHLAGDTVLHDLTDRIVSTLRSYDIFGRYGGEEFLLLLPNTTADEVTQVAKRLLQTVADSPFPVNDHEMRITISIGCTWTDTSQETLDCVLSRADSLLYEAKHGGRNQVKFG